MQPLHQPGHTHTHTQSNCDNDTTKPATKNLKWHLTLQSHLQHSWSCQLLHPMKLDDWQSYITISSPNIMMTINWCQYHPASCLTIVSPWPPDATPLHQKSADPPLEHFASTRVHSETGKTIASHEKLAFDPFTIERWTKALVLELGNTAQCHKETNTLGTNKVF